MWNLKREHHVFRICDAFSLDVPGDHKLTEDHFEVICFYYGISVYDKDVKSMKEAIADELGMEDEDYEKGHGFFEFENSGLEEIWEDRSDKEW